jgi:hypothetical protein
MKLKRVVDSLDGIDEKYHELYEKGSDGKFALNGIENADDYKIVKTVRDEAAGHRVKVRELTNQLEAFAGLKPDEVRASLAELDSVKAELEASGSSSKEKINAAVEARLKTHSAPLEAKIVELSKVNETLAKENGEHKRAGEIRKIDDEMRSACIENKVSESAYTGKYADALRWAREFAVIGADGKITDKETGLPLSGALRQMLDNGEQTHWWGTSKGGGAHGSGDGNAGGVNPYAAESWNISAQGKIEAADMKRAEALAKSAGATLGLPYHPKNGMPRMDRF